MKQVTAFVGTEKETELSVNLYVPLEAAVAWEVDGLLAAFAHENEDALVDDSESITDEHGEDVEWFEFEGPTAEEVQALAQRVLAQPQFDADDEVRVRV